MRYKVKGTDIIDPKIDSVEWQKAEIGVIDKQRWKEFYQPIKTTFKMLRGPEGISILMHTDEKNLRMENTDQRSGVCNDSCMEFFFKPDPWNVNYLNIEINPNKAMYIKIRSGRQDGNLIDVDRDIFSLESIASDGDWTLKFYLPDSFLLSHFGCVASVCRGNFYKCGDLTDHPHYITWSEVEVSKPDFHIPDFFGYIEF